jgi:hypothetical protein
VEKDEDPGSIVVGLRAIIERIHPSQLPEVRIQLAAVSDSSLQPLFEPDPELALLGDVGAAYAKRLASWKPAIPVDEPVGIAASRIRAMAESGWVAGEAFDEIAAGLAASIDGMDPELVGDSAMDDLFQAFSHAIPSAKIDAFAGALQSLSNPERWPLLELALRLPLSDPAQANRRSIVDGWLSSATWTDVEALVDRSRGHLAAAGSAYRAVLAARWRTEKAQAGATLVAAEGDVGVAELLTELGSAPEADYLSLVQQLAPLCRDGRLAELAEASARAIAAYRPSTIAMHFVDTYSALREQHADLSGMVGALEGRITNANPADLRSYFVAAADTHAVDATAVRKAGALLSERYRALGTATVDEAITIVRMTRGSATARLVLVDAISSRRETAADVVGRLSAIRGLLRNHWSLRAALVSRSRSESQDEAAKLLDEATQWRQPPSKERASYSQFLHEIAQSKPELTTVVNRLLDD